MCDPAIKSEYAEVFLKKEENQRNARGKDFQIINHPFTKQET